MDKIRAKKRHSIQDVASYCHVSCQLVRNVESGKLQHISFIEWVCLASYYGRIMLKVPFTVHRLEFPVADVYFMYIRNGEPIQYSAKCARALLMEEEC